MLVFFDTNIHLDLLLGRLTMPQVLAQAPTGPVRLSPVVASELLRGCDREASAEIERLIAALTPIEPSSWRSAFLDAGRLLPSVFPRHEEVGLARLQNDILLALTARQTGAVLITRDGHFKTLRSKIDCKCVVLP
jgi:predicted nucleic acid-binding protein